jgi:hypothetical protein
MGVFMKVKILTVLAAFTLVFAFAFNADAQMMTTDVVFIKLGYIPSYTVTFDDDVIVDGVTQPGSVPDLEASGFAIQGEYNLNLSPLWLGFGVEYQRLIEKDDDDVIQFLIPQVTAKFVTGAGFYLGAGLAGKYLISYSYEGDEYNDLEPDKKIDLWAHGVIGFFMPIAEGVFLDLEGKFGYNLTNSQHESLTVDSQDWELSPNSAYDISIYVGIGFRAFATGI